MLSKKCELLCSMTVLALLSASVQAESVENLFEQANQARRAGNMSLALKLYEQGAELGDAYAQYNLSVMYEKGQGVSSDHAKANDYLLKAAKNKLAVAQFNLGQKYMAGDGVPSDPAEAAKWWELASDQGDLYAKTNLGNLYAMGRGVARDGAKARQLYTEAAMAGDNLARLLLGAIYAKGNDVPQSYELARKWWQKAAFCGYAKAQHNLGLMYAQGHGVAKDYPQAFGWFTLAFEHGDYTAEASLQKVKGLMTEAEIRQAEAITEEFTRKYGQPCSMTSNSISETNANGARAEHNAHKKSP